MRRSWLTLLLVTSCGLDITGVTTSASSSDAGTTSPEAATPADGSIGEDAVPPRVCDRTKPWGTPSLVPDVNTTDRDEGNAWLTPDELTMYLVANAVGQVETRDIFVLTRPNRTAPFGARTPLVVNSKMQDDNATTTGDGLKLYFASSRDGDGGTGPMHVWVATRVTTKDVFGLPVLVEGFKTNAEDNNPFILPGGGTIYFDSFRTGNSDLFYASQVDPTKFTALNAMNELNTAAAEVQPVLTPDGLYIVFGSTRTPNLGVEDLWSASRAKTNVPFGNPMHLESVSSPLTDLPTWISADGCRLYFSSNRNGTRDIWQTER
jgi:hypothetical protein